jgi:hypothetical protein
MNSLFKDSILNNYGIQYVVFVIVLRRVRVIVFNATFNNISVISWWSVLLVEETGIPGKNYWHVASH